MTGTSNKHPALENFLGDLAKNISGRDRAKCKESQTCVKCGGDAKTFKDIISEREYNLSVFCQTCQDNFYGVEDGTDEPSSDDAG